MEETLTLARVIENINYVYGQKLPIALFIFVLLEIVALVFISRKKPEWINYLKIVVLAVATIFGLVFLSRSRVQEGYSKIELNDTTCAFQEIYDAHGPDHMTWADEIIYGQHYVAVYGEEPVGQSQYDISVACQELGFRNLFQIVACLVLYLVGFLEARCVFKGEREYLSAALAAPLGAATITAVTLLFIIARIPYYWFTVAVALMLIVGLLIWYSVKNKLTISKNTVLCVLPGICLIVISVFLKFYKLAGDARWQMLYAWDLVTHHHLMEEFYQVATYGFLGTSLHAFGILFGGDMLYAFFSIVGISAIAVILCSTYYLLEEKKNILVYLFLGAGLLFLISNFDYIYYLEWLLSNCSVGVCLLAIVVLTYLTLKTDIDVTLLLALFSFVVITTRIEGVCYVALLVSVPFCREGALKKANLVVGLEVIIWQIVQFVLSTGVGQDGWTPVKGVALSLVGVLIIIEPYVAKIQFVRKLMNHYEIIYALLLLGLIGVGFVYDKKMAFDNVSVFLSHFTVSKNSNSFAFWGFILILLPVAIRNAISNQNRLLYIFIFYILMIFGISIFRTGNPLHTGTSDSFRRVLCQVMPLTTWLVTYYAGNSNT